MLIRNSGNECSHYFAMHSIVITLDTSQACLDELGELLYSAMPDEMAASFTSFQHILSLNCHNVASGIYILRHLFLCPSYSAPLLESLCFSIFILFDIGILSQN